MRTRALPALLLVAACGASDAGRTSVAATTDPPLLARELVARRVADLVDDSFPLFRPIRIRLLGDTLIVSDMGDDRIVLFDPDLELLHAFGSSGAGPGELQGPYHLQGWNGLIAVGDMTNERVSFFRPDGELVRETRLRQVLRSFAIADDGSIYHISNTGYDTYFTAIAPDGTRRPWGTRPPATRPDTAGGKPPHTGLSDVLVTRTPDNTIHILDALEGVLIRMAADGSADRVVLLPDALLEPIRSRNQDGIDNLARQGIRVVSAPLIKDFTTTADGRLLLALASNNTVAALVDPETYAIREIRVPGEDGPWDAARRASSVAVHGNVLYVVTEEGIYAFALEDAGGA